MKKRAPEIVDPVLGQIAHFKKGAYSGRAEWNRKKQIRFIIHAEGKDLQRCIKSASRAFLAIRKKEMALFRKGIDAVDGKEWKNGFLNEAAETSIEIFDDDEVHLVYLLWMVGTLLIRSTRRGRFLGAEVITG